MGETAVARGGVAKGARGCVFTVIGAVVLVWALLLYGLWDLGRKMQPVPPPDVAAFAHSATAGTGRAGAARRSAADLAALASALPWAEPLGTSASDLCASVENSAMFGRHSWGPVECVRSDVSYVAFDGDVGARLRALDAALAAQGWTGETLTATAVPHDGAASPAPGRGPFTVVRHRDSPSGAGYAAVPHLRVSVAGAPDDPRVDTDGFPYGGTKEVVHLTRQSLDPHTVARAGFAAHRYVAAFSLVTRYVVQP
jgi:hypothetical protein